MLLLLPTTIVRVNDRPVTRASRLNLKIAHYTSMHMCILTSYICIYNIYCGTYPGLLVCCVCNNKSNKCIEARNMPLGISSCLLVVFCFALPCCCFSCLHMQKQQLDVTWKHAYTSKYVCMNAQGLNVCDELECGCLGFVGFTLFNVAVLICCETL